MARAEVSQARLQCDYSTLVKTPIDSSAPLQHCFDRRRCSSAPPDMPRKQQKRPFLSPLPRCRFRGTQDIQGTAHDHHLKQPRRARGRRATIICADNRPQCCSIATVFMFTRHHAHQLFFSCQAHLIVCTPGHARSRPSLRFLSPHKGSEQDAGARVASSRICRERSNHTRIFGWSRGARALNRCSPWDARVGPCPT